MFAGNKCNTAVRLCALALAVLFALAICGCGNKTHEFNEDDMPKPADDKSVLAQWDEYPILKDVPRYTGGGIFDVIVNTSGDAVNVYYNATTQADYEGYNTDLRSAGYKLKEGSTVWTNEGTLGVPKYIKGELQVTLVWSADGTLAICVAYR